MQHIVNIAFDFDDEKVKRTIEQKAETSVIDKITSDIKKIYFEKKYGCDPEKELINKVVNQIVKENQEEIIEKATQLLCEKFYRSKAVKEAALEAIKKYNE